MSVNNSLYNQLSRNTVKYSEKNARRSILIARVTTSEKIKRRHKAIVFEQVSKIVVKNVNNFFLIIKSVESGQVIHEKDDIVQECFIIVDKCIDKFDYKREGMKFYFYLNKSLAQGLYRLKEKNYSLKHNKFSYMSAEDVAEYENSSHSNIINYPLFLGKNFSNKEILLMHSKLEEEDVDEFCKKTEISRNEYYKILKSVKNKIDKKYF